MIIIIIIIIKLNKIYISLHIVEEICCIYLYLSAQGILLIHTFLVSICSMHQ